jgi:Phosphodiester glycosidase
LCGCSVHQISVDFVVSSAIQPSGSNHNPRLVLTIIQFQESYMKLILIIGMYLLLALTRAEAQVLPSVESAASAPDFQQTTRTSQEVRETSSVLRLNLTSNDQVNTGFVRIAGMSICSLASCIDIAAPSSVRLTTTIDGQSVAVAEIALPHMEVSSIKFKSLPGPNILQGQVSLPNSLKLDKNLYRGDVLVVVQKTGSSFTPVAAASNYFHPQSSTFYYNPAFATTVKLPYGVKLTIPAAALASPQVFSVGIRDTGDKFPLVDIYPEVKLTKAADIELTAIVRQENTLQSRIAPTTAGGESLILKIGTTGIVRRHEKHSDQSSDVSPSVGKALPTDSFATSAAAGECNAAGWCSCTVQLNDTRNREIISSSLSITANLYLDWCVLMAPYVHITVSDLNVASMRIKHNNKVNVESVIKTPLRPITTWASSTTQILVNGFIWEGDRGLFGVGGYGLPSGHVFDSFYTGIGTRLLGQNLPTGGACDDFISTPSYSNCVAGYVGSGGNKLTMVWAPTGPNVLWREIDSAAPFTDFINSSYSYVSSSSSVIKNGVCTSYSLPDSWSAIGVTADNRRVVILSSVSGSTTTPAALCPLFILMGLSNAILLDGSRSAGLVVDGILKNPLIGLERLAHGDFRYIPYAIGLGYTSAPPTPSPAPASTGVVKPPNPCRVNPQLCARME